MFYVADYMTGKLVSGPHPSVNDAVNDRDGMAIEEDCVILEKLESGSLALIVETESQEPV